MGLHQDDFDQNFTDVDLTDDPDELKRKKELRKRIEDREEEKRLRKELDDFDYDEDYDWEDKY
jgi:predicted secreted Zn-dependent protease